MLNKVDFIKSMGVLFAAHAQKVTQEIIDVWYDLLKEYDQEQVLFAIKKAAMSSGYLSVGMIVDIMGASPEKINSEQAENEWKQVWESAIHNGEIPISARAAKALNSLGGLEWVKNSDPNNVNWTRKEFLAVYENTPEPADNDFRCLGLLAGILPPKEKQLMLSGEN